MLSQKRAILNLMDARNKTYVEKCCKNTDFSKVKILAVGSATDKFGDSISVKCSKCEEIIFFRLWMLDIIKKYQWEVICRSCAPAEPFLKGLKTKEDVEAGNPVILSFSQGGVNN